MSESGISSDIQSNKNNSIQAWSKLTQSEDKAEYCSAWLKLLFQEVDDAFTGLVVLSEGQEYIPIAQWPKEAKGVERLAEIIEESLTEGCGLISKLENRKDSLNKQYYAIAYPIKLNDIVVAVAALELALDDNNDLPRIMQKLQWGSAWLELAHLRQALTDDQVQQEQLRSSVNLLAAVMAEPEYTAGAMALVTEVAHRVDADRVSIGFLKKNHIHIEAISHTADFTKRMNLIRFLSQAMEESIEQRHIINFSINERYANTIVLAHEELSRQHGAGHILTVPLYHNNDYYAAVLLERPLETPFTESEEKYTQALLGLAGTALLEKRLNDKPLYEKAVLAVKKQWRKLIGPRYAGRKIAVSLVIVSLLFFNFAKGTYRINADITIEGALRRVISTPFNGYVSDSIKRSGDVVQKNTILAKLDDRDLRLERIKWTSQYVQFQRQHREAMAKRNRAQVNILSAQMQQAKAQLDLAESRLKRTEIKAPFNGLVVSGDLSQRLGAAVQQGEVLFEITPLEDYRVILLVNEQRIADIKVGQRGPLVLSALPDEEYYFQIEKILPTTSVNEGENLFRVEARLDNPSNRLRPGMKGIGKVEIEQRRLIGIWTQAMREWVDLQAWKWFGI